MFAMTRRTTRFTLTDTLLPYTTRVRSHEALARHLRLASARAAPRRTPTVATGRSPASWFDLPRAADGTTRVARRASSNVWALRRSAGRSEEHTSELQSLMRISYAVFCLKKKTNLY